MPIPIHITIMTYLCSDFPGCTLPELLGRFNRETHCLFRHEYVETLFLHIQEDVEKKARSRVEIPKSRKSKGPQYLFLIVHMTSPLSTWQAHPSLATLHLPLSATDIKNENPEHPQGI